MLYQISAIVILLVFYVLTAAPAVQSRQTVECYCSQIAALRGRSAAN